MSNPRLPPFACCDFRPRRDRVSCAGRGRGSLSFQGVVQLQDPETGKSIAVNADEVGDEYRSNIRDFRERLRKGCTESRIDYVPLDTSVPYDKALMEYLLSRRGRF